MSFLCFSCRQPPNREDTPTPQPSEKASSINQTPVEANEFPQLPEGLEKKPIVLKFSAVMDGITIGAALLPSLKAEYKMGRMKSHGMTGESERSFAADIHLLDYDWPVDSFISTYHSFCDGPSKWHQSQTQKQNNSLFFCFSPPLFRGTDQFHLWVAKPQTLLPVKGVPCGHVNDAAIGQPHPASGHHVGRVHHGGSWESLRPGLGPWWFPSKARKLPSRQLSALRRWGTACVSKAEWMENLAAFNLFLLMCRLVHLSTTWPQTCSTTWSSCRKSSWRRSMRSFRRSQVTYSHMLSAVHRKIQILILSPSFLPLDSNLLQLSHFYTFCYSSMLICFFL